MANGQESLGQGWGIGALKCAPKNNWTLAAGGMFLNLIDLVLIDWRAKLDQVVFHRIRKLDGSQTWRLRSFVNLESEVFGYKKVYLRLRRGSELRTRQSQEALTQTDLSLIVRQSMTDLWADASNLKITKDS